jgi:xanthine dehydrogenase accessory factor
MTPPVDPRPDQSGPSDATGHADPLRQASAWLEGGERVALATVLKTWGSAPRKAGAQMSINGQRAFVGSVSGGCVESAVIQESEEIMASGEGKLLSFGITDDEAWEVGLACGGQLEVFVEPLHDTAWLTELLAARDDGQAVVVALDMDTGRRTLFYAGEHGVAEPTAGLLSAAEAAVVSDRSERWEGPDGNFFLQVFNPPVRVLIVGAVHIAQPLSVMVRESGLDVAVIDPREAFATEARFPDTTLHRAWPGEALDRIGINRRTAIVTVTHDPKLDDPALQAALRSPAFYIGALGSRRTHAKRVARLQEAGFTEDDIARVHAPVGLDIGARTPGEIAVSVLAEIISVLRGTPG